MAATDFKDYYAILESVRLPVLMKLNRLFANWHANTTLMYQVSRQKPASS